MARAGSRRLMIAALLVVVGCVVVGCRSDAIGPHVVMDFARPTSLFDAPVPADGADFTTISDPQSTPVVVGCSYRRVNLPSQPLT